MPPKRGTNKSSDGDDDHVVRNENKAIAPKRQKRNNGNERGAKIAAGEAITKITKSTILTQSDDSEEAANGAKRARKSAKTSNVTTTVSTNTSRTPRKGRSRNTNCVTNLKRSRADANKRAKEEAEKSRNSEERYQLLEQQLQSLKEKLLAGSNHGRDYVQDDQTIRANLSLLFDLITDWVREWSNRGYLREHLNEADADRVVALLRCESEFPMDKMLHDSGAEAFSWIPNGFRATIEAILCHTVCYDIIARPCHFVTLSSSIFECSMETNLETAHNCMNHNLAATQVWYSSTLRSFYASYQYDGPIVERLIDDNFSEPRSSYYKELVRKLLDDEESPLQRLLRPCTAEEAKERKQELFKIFRAAGKLSLQLWVQDAKVEIFSPLDDNCPHAFHVASDHTEPNASMKVDTKVDLSKIAIDFVYRLGVRFIRFEASDNHGKRMIAAKASVSAFAEGKWQTNKHKHISSVSYPQQDLDHEATSGVRKYVKQQAYNTLQGIENAGPNPNVEVPSHQTREGDVSGGGRDTLSGHAVEDMIDSLHQFLRKPVDITADYGSAEAVSNQEATYAASILQPSSGSVERFASSPKSTYPNVSLSNDETSSSEAAAGIPKPISDHNCNGKTRHDAPIVVSDSESE